MGTILCEHARMHGEKDHRVKFYSQDDLESGEACKKTWSEQYAWYLYHTYHMIETHRHISQSSPAFGKSELVLE